MELNEEQYERVALWLDGQDVSLSEAEKIVADQMRRDEASLAGLADLEVPPAVVQKARQQIVAELIRPKRWVAIAYRLAAAAIVIVAVVWMLSNRKPTTISPQIPIDIALQEMEYSTDAGMVEFLADEIQAFRAELFMAQDNYVMDLQINAMEKELEDIWINGTSIWLLEEEEDIQSSIGKIEVTS